MIGKSFCKVVEVESPRSFVYMADCKTISANPEHLCVRGRKSFATPQYRFPWVAAVSLSARRHKHPALRLALSHFMAQTLQLRV